MRALHYCGMLAACTTLGTDSGHNRTAGVVKCKEPCTLCLRCWTGSSAQMYTMTYSGQSTGRWAPCISQCRSPTCHSATVAKCALRADLQAGLRRVFCGRFNMRCPSHTTCRTH